MIPHWWFFYTMFAGLYLIVDKVADEKSGRVMKVVSVLATLFWLIEVGPVIWASGR